MSGNMDTLRVAGTTGGFPTSADDALKVKFVAPVLVNMSNYSADILKYLGGVESFPYNNTKIEWLEEDAWNSRITLGGSMGSGVTSMTVTGAAHRFPVGSIFFNPNPNAAGVVYAEYVRVTGHVDANTLTVTRAIAGGTSVADTSTWATTDEVFLSGFSMHETDNWVFRPTAYGSMPYNYSQVSNVGVQESYRRSESAFYGDNTLDRQARDTVEQQFVAIGKEAIHGARSAGTSAIPSMFGGMKYYITSANGAQVKDCSGAALTRKDIDDQLQELYYTVGGDKMARTLICSAWAMRKISSFFSSAERLAPGLNQAAGITVNRLNTDFGVIDLMLSDALQKDEMLLIRQENHKIGCHGTKGRPHLEEVPTSIGPRRQTAFYCDLSMINSGVMAEARIHHFSVTA
jgi:hypothetical protein